MPEMGVSSEDSKDIAAYRYPYSYRYPYPLR